MKSSKDEALLVLDWWHDNDAKVSVIISGAGISLDGFAGSIEFVDSDEIEIGRAGLMLSIDMSAASNFSWGEESEEETEFDPATFDSVLRFSSEGMEFALAAVK